MLSLFTPLWNSSVIVQNQTDLTSFQDTSFSLFQWDPKVSFKGVLEPPPGETYPKRLQGGIEEVSEIDAQVTSGGSSRCRWAAAQLQAPPR